MAVLVFPGSIGIENLAFYLDFSSVEGGLKANKTFRSRPIVKKKILNFPQRPIL
jgi:hypothetical protein